MKKINDFCLGYMLLVLVLKDTIIPAKINESIPKSKPFTIEHILVIWKFPSGELRLLCWVSFQSWFLEQS